MTENWKKKIEEELNAIISLPTLPRVFSDLMQRVEICKGAHSLQFEHLL